MIRRLSLAAVLLCAQGAAAWDAPDPFGTASRVPQSREKDLVPPSKASAPCSFGALGSPLGLVETVERALCNNPQTKKAWANARAQAAQLGSNEAAYLPTLNGTLIDNNVHLRATVDGFPEQDVAAHTRPLIRNLTLGYVLYDFGLRSANLENGEQQLIAA